jgi:hypothetical protein
VRLVLSLLSSTCSLLSLDPKASQDVQLAYLSLLALRSGAPWPATAPAHERARLSPAAEQVAQSVFLPLELLLSLVALYSRAAECDRRFRDLLNAAAVAHLLPSEPCSLPMSASPEVKELYRIHSSLVAVKMTLHEPTPPPPSSLLPPRAPATEPPSLPRLPSLAPDSPFWYYRQSHTPAAYLLRLFNYCLPSSDAFPALIGMLFAVDVVGAEEEREGVVVEGGWRGSKRAEDALFREAWCLTNAIP